MILYFFKVKNTGMKFFSCRTKPCYKLCMNGFPTWGLRHDKFLRPRAAKKHPALGAAPLGRKNLSCPPPHVGKIHSYMAYSMVWWAWISYHAYLCRAWILFMPGRWTSAGHKFYLCPAGEPHFFQKKFQNFFQNFFSNNQNFFNFFFDPKIISVTI